jgi:hypothetical protein
MSAVKDKSARIQFPGDIIEIVEEWTNSMERGVGVCLLCGSVIHTEADFIADSSVHNCPAGRSLKKLEPHL